MTEVAYTEDTSTACMSHHYFLWFPGDFICTLHLYDHCIARAMAYTCMHSIAKAIIRI